MAIQTLQTVRDFLRYAVSRFRAEKLAHGHGASSALDEAAFIVLEGLNLPVDDINPWLEARLLDAEKQHLLSLIEARVTTRKPAAYLFNKTYLHGIPFYVDERVIVPRSFIAEIMFNNMMTPDGAALVADPASVTDVLDLCTGSGCLAIMAAGLFPEAQIDATELSADALDVARINVQDHDLINTITLHQGDLFGPVGSKKYDIIIANPPYVAAAEVAAFPPEYAAEPQMAHLGGADGFDLVRRIITEAPRHLKKGGMLICEIGTGSEIIDAAFPRHEFLWIDTEQSVAEVFVLRA
jgi:ribosomal protein L3 glutamine methyltransferase